MPKHVFSATLSDLVKTVKIELSDEGGEILVPEVGGKYVLGKFGYVFYSEDCSVRIPGNDVRKLVVLFRVRKDRVLRGCGEVCQ